MQPNDVNVVYERSGFSSNLEHFASFGFGKGPGPYPLAQVNSGNFTVNIMTDDTTGLLRFEYFENTNSTSVYSVGVLQFWEAENGDPTNIVSGSGSLLGWTATQGPMTDNNQYWYLNAVRGFPGTLMLNTSIPMGAVDNEKTFSAAEINVQINNYEWMSDSSQLVFSWVVNHTIRTGSMDYFALDSGMPEVMIKNVSKKTLVDFDDAYLSAATTATEGNGTSITVSITLANYSNPASLGAAFSTPYSQFVYISYDHFEGALTHDPELGFGAGPKSSSLLWIIIIVIIVVIIVIIVIAVAGFFVWRNRSKHQPDIFQN